MKSAVQVVPFRWRHMPRVLAMERASFGREAWPLETFREYYRDCREWFLVAKVGGRVAGYIIACRADRVAEIDSVAVHPAYRRRGVADTLMRHTLQAVAVAGVRRVELIVRPDNTAGRQLYRSLGFRRARLVRQYYEDGGDGILMVRAVQ